MIALRALCDIEFLDVQDVLAIHSRMISEFGGSPGVKSHEQLESAVQAPRSGYYESYEELARAVLDGIAFGHAFHDGNKRTAIRAMFLFLQRNYIKPKRSDPIGMYEAVHCRVEREWDEHRFVQYLCTLEFRDLRRDSYAPPG